MYFLFLWCFNLSDLTINIENAAKKRPLTRLFFIKLNFTGSFNGIPEKK